jgi:hypothetical protein
VKLLVATPPMLSRNQAWKRQISPGNTATGPVGEGSAPRSMARIPWPVDPVLKIAELNRPTEPPRQRTPCEPPAPGMFPAVREARK